MSNAKLFEFIYESVIEEGGDGDCTVVLMIQKAKDVADEFEKFLGEKEHYFSRNDFDNRVTFCSNGMQESFTFTNEINRDFTYHELNSLEKHLRSTEYSIFSCTQKVVTL